MVCFHTRRTQLVPKVSAYAKVGLFSMSAADEEFHGEVGAGANLHCGPNMRSNRRGRAHQLPTLA